MSRRPTPGNMAGFVLGYLALQAAVIVLVLIILGKI
jgi:hypothetical protein